MMATTTSKPKFKDKSTMQQHKETNHIRFNEEIKSQRQQYISFTPVFKEPLQSDYIVCSDDSHNFKECAVIQRIIHLLAYYKNFQSILHTNESTAPIYEYIQSLPNYGIAMFMEDWYQCKNLHLQMENEIDWFLDNKQINCSCNPKCVYVKRYQRERGNETYQV
eukprot:550210_1